MFYPKSQIKTNLYTNGGEYVYSTDKTSYVGDYFITGDGSVYTGKNPNNKPNDLLIPNSTEDISPSDSGSKYNPSTFYLVDDYYYNAKGIDNADILIPPTLPLQIFPTPTEEEYEIGEIQRFFVKKINDIIYIEISQQEYNRYLNQEPTVSYQLYNPFLMPWVITGNRSNAYKVNKKTVERVQANNNFQGLTSYFKDKYDQLFRYSSNENLYTDGTEFINSFTNRSYIGPYHIHPDKGPMVGAQHIDEPHAYLRSISEVYDYDYERTSSYVTQSIEELRYGGLNGPIGNPITGSLTGSINPNPNAFITTWKTTTPTEVIVMGLYSTLTYAFRVDWGDGNQDSYSGTGLTNISHTYQVAGEYDVVINDDFVGINMKEPTATTKNLIKIRQWGNMRWEKLDNSFYDCSYLQRSNCQDIPVLNSIIDAFVGLREMFFNAGTNSATGFFAINRIEDWDIFNVGGAGVGLNIRGMFKNSAFNGYPIGIWNVSAVNNMAQTFEGATEFNMSLSGWDTRTLKFIGSMFKDATSFNNTVDNFDVNSGGINSLNFVFQSATSFNQTCNSWNTSNIQSMNATFRDARAFNQPLDNWDVGNVTNMGGMFRDAVSFDQDISNWNIIKVTNFNFFLRNVRLSNNNYDNLLIGWEATLQGTYPGGAGYTTPSGQVDFGNSQYKVGTAARTSLINTFGWNITDGGPQ